MKKGLGISVVLVGVILVSLWFGFFDSGKKNSGTSESVSSNKDLENYWFSRIEGVGGVKAYQEFLAKYQNESGSVQHTQSHLFGSALYKAEGLPGVAVCDTNFNFGCYHEFLGWAIHDHGLAVAPSLNEKCLEKHESEALGCQHGIGHGILTSLGYGEKNLFDALNTCEKFREQPSVGGCYGGVFMEYNLETILGDDGKVRTLDEKLGHHHPCSVISLQFKAACYYELPQWWQSVFYDEWVSVDRRAAMYQKMGKWCGEVDAPELRKRCFLGIGNNAPPIVGWNIEEMKAVCQSMPDQVSQLECRAASAAVFYGAPGPSSFKWTMCEGLSERDYAQCLSVAQAPR